MTHLPTIAISEVKTEPMDDVPLILAQLENMQVAHLLDKHFPTHGNWQGLSLGHLAVVFLTFMISEGDHRLVKVQKWSAALLLTLRLCLKTDSLCELDFTDDRLASMLDYLGSHDSQWEAYEAEQNECLIRVYDLKASRTVRLDTTTAQSYVDTQPDGLFQLGHSKQHRPDLPQLKISLSTLDPLGMPLTVSVVSGNSADDPLYIPEIEKVCGSLQRHGLLYVGDCKMSSLDTRAHLVSQQDYYLSPLSAVQMPSATLTTLLEPVWQGTQTLTSVYRPTETDGSSEESEAIAEGFLYTVNLSHVYQGETVTWQEQRAVIRSFKQAQAQQKNLDTRLKKAEAEIAALNKKRGRGNKLRDAETIRTEVEAILTRYRVKGLLDIDYHVEEHIQEKRGYGGQPAREIKTTTATVSTGRNLEAYENTVRHLGWRVYVCNDLAIQLTEIVLAYRDQYLVELNFGRLRSKLNITPLYLNSVTRIKGLIRLLSIVLKAMTLIEHTVRQHLKEQDATLDGIYDGNPKRKTDRPTTERLLGAFLGLALVTMTINGVDYYHTTPLNATQTQILDLLKLPQNPYASLDLKLHNRTLKISEP